MSVSQYLLRGVAEALVLARLCDADGLSTEKGDLVGVEEGRRRSVTAFVK